MSQQIQITGGAKVRDLNDVIIGTSGVLSSLAFNVSNGVPKLDVNGKILVSQLPNSVMEYLGTWDASTNTPTLVNGTGNAGDVYLCSVAGTVNFGAGAISFVVSDQVIYSGTIWQKASGSNGTVTSVAASITGDSLGITGSPITTAGTLAFAYAGTNLQYVNGAGNLTTFPTLISSIGLSMPSAFSVSNSPLTANGTIAVTGAGYPSQYIRGDGTLADFPTSGGGGSSVSYYLNGGTSQGVIGGTTYYEMSKTAVIGTGVDFPLVGNGLIVAFLTDAGDPAQLNIPAGNWNYEIYASMSANGGTPQMYAELYKYDGTTFTLISTSTNEILYDGVNLNLYTFAMAVPATSLFLSDRLAVLLYATNSGGKTTTVHTQDGHLCQVITTFSTGITALNNLTAQVQYFATGSSGSDFNISSSTATHTFNIPDAGASARGLITTGTQTIGGVKTFNSAITGDGGILLKTGSPTSLVGYTGLSGDDGNLQIIGKVGSTSYINNLQFTSSTANTYTFPAATGTLALLESTQTFTGTNTFNSGIKAESGIFLKELSSSGRLAGYVGISTTATGGMQQLQFLYPVSGSSVFSLPTVGSYNYEFPTASGTIALTSSLASYVPYTGATADVDLGAFILSAGATSSNIVYANGSGSSSGMLYLKQGTIAANYTGYNGIYATSTSYGFIADTGASYKNAIFSLASLTNVTPRTFTLPDLSGTLALLEGTQTFTGIKTFNLSTINETGIQLKNDIGIVPGIVGYTNLNGLSGGLAITNSAGVSNNLLVPSTTGYSYTFPNATGTIALTSNLSSYLPLAGGTLTGALSGTSASFSSTATATAFIPSGATVPTNGMYLSAANTLNFATNTTNRLTIASTGEAIFSSSVQITGYLAPTSGAGLELFYLSGEARLFGYDRTGSVYKPMGIGVSGTQLYLAINGNVGIGTSSPTYKFETLGTSVITAAFGRSDYGASNVMLIAMNGYRDVYKQAIGVVRTGDYDKGDMIFCLNAAANSTVVSASDERMRITSGGKIGIGTSIPSQPLQLGLVSVIAEDANSMYIGANFGNSTGGVYIKSQYANQIHFDSATGVMNFKIASSGTAGNNISFSNAMTISYTGAVVIAGSLSKGSGSFRIEHPLKSLSETHQLVHSFIEGPKADLIYRGKLTLVNGKAQANIDEISTMTEGTFEALCREVQCFTTNESGWDLVKGKVIGNIIYIESQNTNSTDEISWMVIGERKDKHMMDTEWTDINGKVIVEPLKPIEIKP